MKYTLQRILRNGLLNFRRNSWLSLATISIFSLTLFMLLGLLFFSILTDAIVDNLKNKIDISVYFSDETSEDQIIKIKDALESLQDIRNIEYVSKDEALKRFKETHKDNQVLMQALRELGVNPLQAALNVKTNDISNYEMISAFLERDEFRDIVEKVNYQQNKDIIIKMNSILDAVRKSGFGITLFLGIIAVLVAFNTIRLAIYTSKEEISIMRLVGASNWFIRGPFIFTGALYGAVAAIIAVAIAYPIVLYTSPKITQFIELDILKYFHQNFFDFFLVLLSAGVVLGVVGSYVAIRRHLKV